MTPLLVHSRLFITPPSLHRTLHPIPAPSPSILHFLFNRQTPTTHYAEADNVISAYIISLVGPPEFFSHPLRDELVRHSDALVYAAEILFKAVLSARDSKEHFVPSLALAEFFPAYKDFAFTAQNFASFTQQSDSLRYRVYLQCIYRHYPSVEREALAIDNDAAIHAIHRTIKVYEDLYKKIHTFTGFPSIDDLRKSSGITELVPLQTRKGTPFAVRFEKVSDVFANPYTFNQILKLIPYSHYFIPILKLIPYSHFFPFKSKN